jgi:hypothetical protein
MVSVAIIVAVCAGFYALHRAFDHRYRGQANPTQQPTGEVFRDPATGRLTRVYEDPRTGERAYRREI